MRAAGAATASLTAALLVATGAARAAEPGVRTTGLHRGGGRLAVSVGVQDLFGPREIERLHSGFASRVLVRVALHRVGEREPVARSFRHTEIVYDIWDEKFRLRRQDMGAPTPVMREVATAREAVEQATALVAFPVAELARLVPGARYRLSVRADLNPLSQDLLADVRRWLARPPGSGRLAPGDSFFGSVVSIFVNPRIEESERQVAFVSQVFVAAGAGR